MRTADITNLKNKSNLKTNNMNKATELIKPDYSHWAKKFDKVKHIYASSGTVCGSAAHCLGNNYSTTDMPICKECLTIKNNGGK
jgi:hypothetical protein